MKKPNHVILALTSIDKKKAQVGMPPRESLRGLLDTLDRTPILVMSTKVWKPIGIVYEETTQYTTNPTGFYPPGTVQEMDITNYIQRRQTERSAGPVPEPAPEPENETAETASGSGRKIIIKSDKREVDGSGKGNATKA